MCVFFFSSLMVVVMYMLVRGGAVCGALPCRVLASSGLDCVPAPPPILSLLLLAVFSPCLSCVGLCCALGFARPFLPPHPVLPSSPPSPRSAYTPDRPSPSVPPFIASASSHASHTLLTTHLSHIQTHIHIQPHPPNLPLPRVLCL